MTFANCSNALSYDYKVLLYSTVIQKNVYIAVFHIICIKQIETIKKNVISFLDRSIISRQIQIK